MITFDKIAQAYNNKDEPLKLDPINEFWTCLQIHLAEILKEPNLNINNDFVITTSHFTQDQIDGIYSDLIDIEIPFEYDGNTFVIRSNTLFNKIIQHNKMSYDCKKLIMYSVNGGNMIPLITYPSGLTYEDEYDVLDQIFINAERETRVPLTRCSIDALIKRGNWASTCKDGLTVVVIKIRDFGDRE